MSKEINTTNIERRHDLDALRAAAMLAGIVLHASLSMSAIPWMVQDTQQNETFQFIFSSLHGFRMPLFFLISGFFTTMLWRKRGLKSLIRHRFKRIFLPLLLGVFTISPVMLFISKKAIDSGAAKAASGSVVGNSGMDIWLAARLGEVESIKQHIENGTNLNEQESTSGVTPLVAAAITGQAQTADLLLKNGADVNAYDKAGSTALHAAAFFGHTDTVKVLLHHGADTDAKNGYENTPLETLSADWETTKFFAELVQIELDQEKVLAERKLIATLLKNPPAANKQFLSSDTPGQDKPQPKVNIWTAVQNGDAEALDRYIAIGADLNVQDTVTGITLLNLAVIERRTEMIRQLLQHGADINMQNSDGGTALHTAAFFGNADAAELLLQNGAEVNVKNNKKFTPLDLVSLDWNTTQFIASILKIKLDREEVEIGRQKTARLLRNAGAESAGGLLNALLFQLPIFSHLWFLWFLSWLVAGFAIYAKVSQLFHWQVSSGLWLLSSARYLWLIPLTLIPQWYMFMPGYGPDTSIGLAPMPHLLFFYAIFFGFGALYYDANDTTGQVGKRYWITLPLALLVAYPLGLAFTEGSIGNWEWMNPTLRKLIEDALQVTYAWMMTFGCMGLFRKILKSENRTIRYLSDSSYWLYIAHLPLIIWLQMVVRDWPIPALAKLILICAIASGLLLIVYQYLVRYTWLGRMLNGPRKRPAEADA